MVSDAEDTCTLRRPTKRIVSEALLCGVAATQWAAVMAQFKDTERYKYYIY